MNSGRRIVVITLVFVGVLAIVLLLLPSREPVCEGHKLSWWTDQYGDPLVWPINPEHDAAQRAIQQIGTNALPTLLEWIHYDEPPWRTRLLKRLYANGGAPAFLQTPSLRRLAMGAAGRHARYDAMEGLCALGPAAMPAVVELEALVASKSPFVSMNAMDAILHMQGQARLTLDDPDINVRRAATNALRTIAAYTKADTSALLLPDIAPDRK